MCLKLAASFEAGLDSVEQGATMPHETRRLQATHKALEAFAEQWSELQELMQEQLENLCDERARVAELQAENEDLQSQVERLDGELLDLKEAKRDATRKLVQALESVLGVENAVREPLEIFALRRALDDLRDL